MPELPEVETVVRSLAPHLPGRRIEDCEFSSHFVVREDFETLRQRLLGRTITSVARHGKFIALQLDQGRLFVHLGMTGKLLLDAPPTAHTRASLYFADGVLRYDDIRHFGRIEWEPARVEGLGPDPLEIRWEEFAERLRARRSRIKPLLLNQAFLRGLGNIYVDEALHRAGIHPLAIASRLSGTRARRLYDAIGETLRLAIEHRGSSVSDYVDAAGEKGGFQLLHQVYGKEGQACARCGGVIRRIVVGQRGTHYCPRCQRA
jgi:formamidopyrimidine-DNA glycosylase